MSTYRISIEYFGANGPKDVSKWPPSVDLKDITSDEQKGIGRLTDLIVCFHYDRASVTCLLSILSSGAMAFRS